MKNFKKILALITIAVMSFSFCVYAELPEYYLDSHNATASSEIQYTLESTVSGTTVKEGDTFDVVVKLGLKGSTDYVGLASLNFGIDYDPDLFSVALSSSMPSKAKDVRIMDEDEENYYYYALHSGFSAVYPAYVNTLGNTEINYAGDRGHIVSTENDFAIFTFTVKSVSEDKEVTIDFNELNSACMDVNKSLTFSKKDGSITSTPITFNVTAGGEEVFTPTYEGFVEEEGGEVKTGFKTGSKIATVFAKATGNLAAGEYGIVFGGHKYVGADDVLDGNYWVIRLYDPDGDILDFSKEYDCQIFVGETTTDADYQTATKN